ncbi:hypothetical protein AB0M95_30720 [Sphaerisporangium sp. NPDC051017]|uniref:hypothetical protein n=1 Tax=Sphaerisporangium sp. NPDC051017 TaxID=3154636 RepID=UPI00342899A0
MSVKPLLPREVDDKLVPLAWRKAVYANPNLPQGAMRPLRDPDTAELETRFPGHHV